MRMWMVNPKILCQRHLLGEHVELHMFLGAMRQKKSLKGYFDNDLIEPESIYHRHNELAEEITCRGMNHFSPITFDELEDAGLEQIIEISLNHKINRDHALLNLIERCPVCRSNYEILNKKQGI